jgi:hypothetical protein
MTKDESIKQSAIQRLIDNLGNPLEWSYANKILIFLGLQIVVYTSVDIYGYAFMGFISLQSSLVLFHMHGF